MSLIIPNFVCWMLIFSSKGISRGFSPLFAGWGNPDSQWPFEAAD